MWELISEDLTGLGGPMGTDNTPINFRKFFKSIENAKKYAEKDYKCGKISWRVSKDYVHYNSSKYSVTSGDLGYVMYRIRKIETED